jgi:predicted RNA-binding Zn ribbon-like protein
MKFVGGTLCLDFVNTVDVWTNGDSGTDRHPYGDTPLREQLVDYEALAQWGQLAQVLGAREGRQLIGQGQLDSVAASGVLQRARLLRRSLYRLFKSILHGWKPDPADLDVLNGELAIARAHERLVHHRGGFEWRFEVLPNELDRILWPVASSAAELLCSAELAKLRQCRSTQCGWLFLDTTRNHSRSWCDMSDCGNLNKVRRFRQKQPSTGATRE